MLASMLHCTLIKAHRKIVNFVNFMEGTNFSGMFCISRLQGLWGPYLI